MMKIKGLKGLVVGAIVMSLMLTCTAFATDKFMAISNEFDNMDESEVMASLSSKNFNELIDEINVVSENVDLSGLIYHASALAEKAADVSSEQLQAEILDTNNSSATRVVLLQISRILGIAVDNEMLTNLVEQDGIDFEIKRNALINFYNSNPNDIAVLEKIAFANDDMLAFQAIKMLNQEFPEKAAVIADSILQNYNGIVTERVRAAIKVKASQLEKTSTLSERQNFINFCDNILKTTGEKSDIVADTVVFALSDVMSEETISYIVTSDKIDSIAKTSCIDQNYTVLKSMLTDSTSNKSVKVVMEAMTIYPIKEMIEPLQSALNFQLRSRTAESEELSKEIQDTISLINENNLSATGKY